jgi:hypothetical protein
MGKSKKGSRYEREICKKLSRWWTNDEMDDVFWRTAGSGARATTRMKQGVKTADSYGDVGSIRKIGKLLTKNVIIEIKRGYTKKKGKKSLKWASITDIIDTQRGSTKTLPAIYKWWLELQIKRKESDRKSALLIFKRDRRIACVIMSYRTFRFIERKSGVCPYPDCTPFVHIRTIDLDIVIMQLDFFLTWCKPKVLGHKG